MTKVTFPYGKEHITYDFKGEDFKGTLVSKLHEYKPEKSGIDLIKSAMENPIGTEKLSALAKGKEKIVIIASDHTRPVPSKIIIPPMLEEIRSVNPDADITFLIATGCHRDTRKEELIEKFGISACFDKILGAENTLAESKIDRAKAFFKELNINRNGAILIGDTLHDLETANALGIDCVLVSYGHQGRRLLEEHNAFTVNSLKDVEKFLFDNRIVDFHTHSTCSDGTLTPKELVNHAKKSGLSAFALTDHDSVDGIKEAKEEAERIGIEFIPGIEFSAAENTETHIIGLFINPENETLLKTIEKLKGSRKRRMEEICFKLRNLGMDITHDEALEIAGGNFVGRAHIAKLMVEKGYCETIKECFEKYIGLGKPAYAEKNELSAVEAVKAIRAAGGLAFLAHLNQTGYSLEQLEELLLKLKSAGLNGIEGYYPEYTAEQISDYRALAEKLSLCFSGGSDYHAAMKPHIQIGVGTGDLSIPYFVHQNMKNILKID